MRSAPIVALLILAALIVVFALLVSVAPLMGSTMVVDLESVTGGWIVPTDCGLGFLSALTRMTLESLIPAVGIVNQLPLLDGWSCNPLR